jgi:hypothetical protein
MMFTKAENGLPREFRGIQPANHISIFFGYQAEADFMFHLVPW